MRYRDAVHATRNTLFANPLELLSNAALGLCGESGEVADLIKKILYQGHLFDRTVQEKLLNELGDIRWYLELAAIAMDVTMEEIEERNVAKLKARYPDGFSSDRSRNRTPDGIG